MPTSPSTLAARFTSLHHLVGNTPLIEVLCSYQGKRIKVYAKHEVMNFTGSIKDRMALHIVEQAWLRGELAQGHAIAEATSGNTGIALAAIGRALGHPVHIFMPDWMSRERVLLLRSLGAHIVSISAEEGGFRGSVERADAFAAAGDSVFRSRQFDNEANVEAHRRTTGPELLEQMRRTNAEPGAFVAGVGTGGTVMGVGRYLREELEKVAIHPLEPANSPTLRTGHRIGTHRIQGISDEFIPAIVDLDWLDDIVDAWDGDAIRMAQRLGTELGLGVGISSGANFLGAVQVGAALGAESVVATVFPDSNKKYLSTDLAGEEPPLPEYLCNSIRLLGCRVHPRLDPGEFLDLADGA